MAQNDATILIPDISGFTEFMTTTELDHGSHAIKVLLDSIITAVGDEYEISEIEGDAVLMFKRGPAPTKKEMVDICLKIFDSFHFRRKWMQQHTICPCGACQAIINLTLKFVAHHGQVGEMRVGRFVTLSGTDVIVAHRLLKNSIDSREYLLLTEKLWQHFPDSHEPFEFEWKSLSDEFSSIGKIDYKFAHLETARDKTPDPPAPDTDYRTDNTSHFELSIAANFKDAYMVLMNIPGRIEWVPGLQKVEQESNDLFVGSNHHFIFDTYQADVSPVRMNVNEQGVFYAESFRRADVNISLVYEYVFKKIEENTCNLSCRFLNANEEPIPEELKLSLSNDLHRALEKLKEYCEKKNV